MVEYGAEFVLKEIGLVDELGTLTDAVKFAAQKAGLKSYHVEAFPKRMTPFEQIFKDLNEEGRFCQNYQEQDW